MSTPRISAIAIITRNRVLGNNNSLLFHISDDLKRFKKITSGHPVIMGRKTFESKQIDKRPLPGRLNIVVSRNNTYLREDVLVCKSLNEAILKAKENDPDEIFIIGGGQIYREALPYVDRLYLTVVDKEGAGDTYFPDYSDFTKVIYKESRRVDNLSYFFLELEKK